MIAEPERAGMLMRLFAALFLLLPGIALVASTYRRLHPMASVVLLFVAVHAVLHLLAIWRAAATRPTAPLLRVLDAHAAMVMLAATVLIVAISATVARLSPAACAGLLLGASCQFYSLRWGSQRLRHALLVLGSMLQFIAMALLTLDVAG